MNLKQIRSTENLKGSIQEAKDDGYDGVKVITRAKLEMKENNDDDSGKYPVTMSTSEPNRNGRMVVSNFVAEYYKENPVLLDSHKYDSIEHIVGRVENLRTNNGNLEGDLLFNDQLKGRMAEEMVKNGFLQAVSIGYLPLEFEEKELESGETVTLITKAELLELSMVSVPSNRKTLIKQVESMDEKETEQIKDKLDEEARVLSQKNKNDIKKAQKTIDEARAILDEVLNRADKEEKVEDDEIEDTDTDTEAESDRESEVEDEDGEDTVEDDNDAENASESLTVDKILENVIEDARRERRQKLKNVAKALNDTHQGNVNEKKREVWKNLRDLM